MNELLLFFAVAIALPLGTVALFRFFTSLVEATPSKTTDAIQEPSREIEARWEEFGRELRGRQNRSEDLAAPASAPGKSLVNPPLLIVVGSLSLIAVVYLLTNWPMFGAAAVALLMFVGALIFSRRVREQQQEQRSWPDSVSAEGNVSVTDVDVRQPIELETGLSVDPQAARQPTQVPAKEPAAIPATQAADWTAECDDVVSALISLKIPKREAISLVRQSPGTAVDEILRHALKIRDQGRRHFLSGGNGRAPTD